MSPQRLVVVPARRFAGFVNRPEIQAAFAVLVICTALVTVYLAKQSYDDGRAAEQRRKDQATQQYQACLRSQRLAPPLFRHFDSFEGTSHAIDEKTLREYRATVPKTCPK